MMRFGATTLAALMLTACAIEPGDKPIPKTDPGSFDQALLAQFKRALPTKQRLHSATPQEVANAAGDALLPQFAVGPAQSINAFSIMMVDVVEAIVQNPPTVYSEEEKKFLWGPYDNDDGVGNVALYIQENPPGDDMQYTYAFIRLPADNNWDEAKAVIWGAATPDPDDDDLGVGATLYDFDLDRAFDEANDPAFDASAARTTGRLIAVYGNQNETDGNFKFNVAILRNLMPEEGTDSGLPINLNYFFGRFTGQDQNTLTFLDWEQADEICDANRNCFDDYDPQVGSSGTGVHALEIMTIHMAFANDGRGRAEGVVAYGDLGDPETDQVVGYAECWNDIVEQTAFFVDVNLNDAASPVSLHENPECLAPFDNDLDTLGIPSLNQLRQSDGDMLDNMECMASRGMAGCQACIDANGGDASACD